MNLPSKTFLFGMILSAFVSHTASANDHSVYKIEFDQNPIDIAGGAFENSNVRLSLNALTTTTSVHNECFGLGEADRFGLLLDKKAKASSDNPYPDGTTSGTNQSWLFIENLGSAPITRVVFHGVSLQLQSDLFCDFVLKDGRAGIDYTNGVVLFPYGQTVCGEITADLTAFNAIEGWDDSKPYTYQDVAVVRFTLTGVSGNTGSGTPFIQSIEVFAEGSVLTDLSQTGSDEEFTAAFTGDRAVFSKRAANIGLYDVSGRCLARISNANEYGLNALSSGLYVIRATDETGKTVAIKIIKR